MSSIAAETRRAVDQTPYLRQALRAGVLNYTEAARRLDVAAEPGAVASALRRYEEELPPLGASKSTVSVRMERQPEAGCLSVVGTEPDLTDQTAITISGSPDPGLFGRALSALHTASVSVSGAGFVEGTGVVLVPSEDGATALRSIEAAIPE
mgnify:CR=1 FL=1|jgi:hypothetical protein